MLEFPDDTQIRVTGLNDIMAELYSEGKDANEKIAEEIIKRLEDRKNYIPDSGRIRRDYAYVLLKKYRKYIKEKEDRIK